MTLVRASIVQGAYTQLASGVVIAVRYAAVRQQEPGAKIERAVLDYPSLQYRLLPYVAAAYALMFQGRAMVTMNDASQSLQDAGDFSMAASLHATSSALKSLCTTISSDGIEECRRACGGHGFSMSSGLPQAYANSMPSFTAEGDNWLLTQQTVKYLYSVVQGTEEEPAGVSGYLADHESMLGERCSANTVEEMIELPMLQRAFEVRTASEIAKAVGKMAAAEAAGDTDVFMGQLVMHYAVSKAHGLVSIVSAFNAAAEEMRAAGSSLAPVFVRMASLFALSWIEVRFSIDCSGLMFGAF